MQLIPWYWPVFIIAKYRQLYSFAVRFISLIYVAKLLSNVVIFVYVNLINAEYDKGPNYIEWDDTTRTSYQNLICYVD